VLNANLKRCVNKQEFLGSDLHPFFDQWAGSRSLNVLSARSADSAATDNSHTRSRSFHNRNKNSYKAFSNSNANNTKGKIKGSGTMSPLQCQHLPQLAPRLHHEAVRYR
jgi:hypothetical protein